jgi:hypothetical protein
VDILDQCESKGCDKPAERLTSSETRIIQLCRDCYNQKYKK